MGGNFVKMSGVSQSTVSSYDIGRASANGMLSPREVREKETRNRARKGLTRLLNGLLFDLFGIKSNFGELEFTVHQLVDLYKDIDGVDCKGKMLIILKSIKSLEIE